MKVTTKKRQIDKKQRDGRKRKRSSKKKEKEWALNAPNQMPDFLEREATTKITTACTVTTTKLQLFISAMQNFYLFPVYAVNTDTIFTSKT